MELDNRRKIKTMSLNKNSGYGQAMVAALHSLAPTLGRSFFVTGATGTANLDDLQKLFTPDTDGTSRIYATYTLALAACGTNRGDVIFVDPLYTTAPTLTELATANTKGVLIRVVGNTDATGVATTLRATATLPATTATPYFTVTGKVRIIDIIGEVTTVVQTQANNTKLIANPTVGADVDMCAVLDITAAAVGSIFTITGTLANAMVKTVSGAGVAQAAPLIVTAGTIDLSCAATNTGATKWLVRYIPLDPGAAIFAA